MTKEEAYNTMQEGIPVSHIDFKENEYLYMDENFIIRDENDDEFESSWDAKDSDRWKTGWYIYKNMDAAKKKKLLKRGKELPNLDLISHIQGKPCPGEGLCLQYSKLGKTACLFCDTQDNMSLYSSIASEAGKRDKNSRFISEETLKSAYLSYIENGSFKEGKVEIIDNIDRSSLYPSTIAPFTLSPSDNVKIKKKNINIFKRIINKLINFLRRFSDE